MESLTRQKLLRSSKYSTADTQQVYTTQWHYTYIMKLLTPRTALLIFLTEIKF